MHRVASSGRRADVHAPANAHGAQRAVKAGLSLSLAAGFRGLAPIWDPCEVASLLEQRHHTFARGELELVEVRRGAVRLSRGRIDATYELIVAVRSEDPTHEREHRRFALVRLPLAKGVTLDMAPVLLTPEDPRLDTARLSDAEPLRCLAWAALEGGACEIRGGAAVDRGALPGTTSSWPSQEWLAGAELARSDVVAHRFGSRFVRRVTFSGDGAELDLCVKMRRAPRSVRLCLAPADHGVARVPRHLALSHGDRFVIDASEWVDARSLHDRLVRGEATSTSGDFAGDPSMLSLAGAALADFHARAQHAPNDSSGHSTRGRQALEPRSLAGELLRLGEIAASVTQLFGGAREPFHRALASLAADAAATSEPDRSPSPLHGDLHDKQILIDRDGAAFIDLDAAAIGERELDLGNLLAHFTLRALQAERSLEDASHAAALLLAGYSAHSSSLRPDRVALYQRATLIRLALIYLLRLSSTHLFEPLLLEAKRLRTKR